MVRRRSSLLVGALAASLAVNLMAAGYIGYMAFRPKPPRTVDRTIEFVTGRYPSTIGGDLRGRLEAKRGDLERALDEMKQARRATRDVMAAEPYDPAKVEQSFALAREKLSAFQSLLHGEIAAAAGAASAQERGKIERDKSD